MDDRPQWLLKSGRCAPVGQATAEESVAEVRRSWIDPLAYDLISELLELVEGCKAGFCRLPNLHVDWSAETFEGVHI